MAQAVNRRKVYPANHVLSISIYYFLTNSSIDRQAKIRAAPKTAKPGANLAWEAK